jgi:H+/Cl- antiporter ClcA
MSEQFHTLLLVIVVSLGLGITGSALSVSWLRLTQGEWPDRDTIQGLAKIFFGLGAIGLISYLLFKYG